MESASSKNIIMDNTVYLHVGYPKTGTTFLQQEYYPSIDDIYYINQKELFESDFLDIILDDYFTDDQLKYNNILRKWKDEAGNKPLFISYEGFVGNLLTGMQNFPLICERLKGTKFEFKILLTIRKQQHIVDSLYVQYVHQGGAISFNKFMQLPSKSPLKLSLNIFKYDKLYNELENNFGKHNVTLLPMELLKDSKGLNLYFSKYFNISINLQERKFKKRNVGLSGFSLKILRVSNRFISSWVSPNGIIPAYLINAKSLKNFLQKVNRSKKKNIFFEKNTECMEYLSFYKESNEKLVASSGVELKKKYNYI
jgi:hypothetical protein